jgi:urocanate hydratase
VLLANSLLVPKWATLAEHQRLEALGLTMYGQMTAGSWIYIGTQGIVQGTYETFAACARQHFGGDLKGRLVVTGGLGGMGGAQPLAATMNGGAILCVEVDPARIERRIATGYLMRRPTTSTRPCASSAPHRRAGEPLSVGLLGNCAEVLPELVRRNIIPDIVTDQTSAHDELHGYVPDGLTLDEAAELRARDPAEYVRRSVDAMGKHVAAMRELQNRGAVAFDYGNNIRAQAVKAGVADAFEIKGFIPLYIRPLFCEGQGPFRWAALSGDPQDILTTDRAILELFPEKVALRRWIDLAQRADPVPGPALPDLLARLRRTRPRRPALQRARAHRQGQGPDRHRPRPPRLRLGRLAQPRDRGHARRLGRRSATGQSSTR